MVALNSKDKDITIVGLQYMKTFFGEFSVNIGNIHIRTL